MLLHLLQTTLPTTAPAQPPLGRFGTAALVFVMALMLTIALIAFIRSQTSRRYRGPRYQDPDDTTL